MCSVSWLTNHEKENSMRNWQPETETLEKAATNQLMSRISRSNGTSFKKQHPRIFWARHVTGLPRTSLITDCVHRAVEATILVCVVIPFVLGTCLHLSVCGCTSRGPHQEEVPHSFFFPTFLLRCLPQPTYPWVAKCHHLGRHFVIRHLEYHT